MQKHSFAGEIGERGRTSFGCEPLQAAGQAQRLAHDPIQYGPADSCIARSLPGEPQLRSDFSLARLRRIEPTGGEEQMLDSRFADPGA
jgi:hypothetical protein